MTRLIQRLTELVKGVSELELDHERELLLGLLSGELVCQAEIRAVLEVDEPVLDCPGVASDVRPARGGITTSTEVGAQHHEVPFGCRHSDVGQCV